MKLSALKIDASKLERGDWVGDIPDLGDIRLKVRGIGNADHRRRRGELYAALPRGKRKDVAALDAIDVQLLVETILIGWENVLDDHDEPIPYSAETATRLLGDPDLAVFRAGVVWAASVVAERAEESVEADAGN